VVPGREYREYRLGDYSGWLRNKIEQKEYWKMALGCIVGSKACDDVQFWSPLDFLQRDLTPVQVQMKEYWLVKEYIACFFFLFPNTPLFRSSIMVPNVHTRHPLIRGACTKVVWRVLSTLDNLDLLFYQCK
jgi:hypothetical protein